MLHSLKLSRFRNIDYCCLEFSSGINAFVGNNGQGKTNILEAIYYLALLRSFRTSQINDLKQWKADVFRLEGNCCRQEQAPVDLEVVYGAERKLLLNGNPVYRTSEFINSFICITFIPQDMELIRGTEVLRRRFLDITVSQLSPSYLKNLQGYNEALKSRNALLKDRERYPQAVIRAYDKVLVQKGIQIELERRRFAEALNVALENTSGRLIEDGRKLSVKYLSGIGTLLQPNDDDQETMEARFIETLDKSFERDCRDGFTHYGPHRAELSCLLNKQSLLHYGSEGECRIASLAIKFACLDIIRSANLTKDVTLIVDDVIGELDATRQKNFFAELEASGQIIIAGTFLPDCIRDSANVFSVNGGKAVQLL